MSLPANQSTEIHPTSTPSSQNSCISCTAPVYEAPQVRLNELSINGGRYSYFTENTSGMFQAHS